jgi:hypothetical protein
MSFLLLVTVVFIIVHGPDQQSIEVNAHEISSLREPRKGADEHFGKNVNCLIGMSNGKLINVIETCAAIVEQIHGANGGGK